MQITELEDKPISEILNMFQNIQAGQALRIMTKTGFIVGVGGLVHKMENGVLYVATKKGWYNI